MADHKLVLVSTYFSEAEAEIARGWLAEHDIGSYVEGASAATALSYVGGSIASAKLLVRADAAQAAIEILSQFESTASIDHPWYCGECKEFNEGSFDICWKCNRPHEEVAQSAPAPTLISAHTPSIHQAASSSEPPAFDQSNDPYRVPRAQGTTTASEDDFPLDQAQEDFCRAWKRALLGVALPVLLNVYSIHLLLKSYYCTQGLTSKNKSTRIMAWVFNAIVIAYWFILVTYPLSPTYSQ